MGNREPTDVWAQWLLGRRDAGDPAYRQRVQAEMGRVRDRVLDAAKLATGMTLVDVGAGEGLIGFGALDRLGPAGRVVFTDVSAPLLRYAEGIAVKRGVRAQCAFVHGTAERLDGLADGSVDVVATRASLAYVQRKDAALREFHRVLRPGGRISLAEPVCQDEAFQTCAIGRLIEAQPAHPDRDYLRLLHRFRSAQFPSTEPAIAAHPLTNFSERDLVPLAGQAGFPDVHVELHIDHGRSPPIPWDVYLDISPHPWAPTLREVMAERFSPAERELLERVMRPLVESGRGISSEATAYLSAEKPAEPDGCQTTGGSGTLSRGEWGNVAF